MSCVNFSKDFLINLFLASKISMQIMKAIFFLHKILSLWKDGTTVFCRMESRKLNHLVNYLNHYLNHLVLWLVEWDWETMADDMVLLGLLLGFAFHFLQVNLQELGRCYNTFGVVANLLEENYTYLFRFTDIETNILINIFLFFFRALSESERKSNQTITSNIIFKENPDINLYIFAGLVLVTMFSNIFRAMYFFATLVRCSRQLHNTMFKSLLKAPMYFFDTNPVGELNICFKLLLLKTRQWLEYFS